jgi:hypothetical protein
MPTLRAKTSLSNYYSPLLEATPTNVASSSSYSSLATSYSTTPLMYNTGTGSAAYTSTAYSGPDVGGTSVKQCYNCLTTSTVFWRRDPETQRTLCNACGLYLQQRREPRPQALIDADYDEESEGSDGASTGPQCSHCHTRITSVFRRNMVGDQVCNACGVYARLNGKPRPLSLGRNKIKPRARASVQDALPPNHGLEFGDLGTFMEPAPTPNDEAYKDIGVTSSRFVWVA